MPKVDESIGTWTETVANVNLYLNKEEEKCLDVLALSYEDMSPSLKSYFLYFGVFPEDFEILARQLIQLWIAEGFIMQDKSKKIEDVAEEYLEELIDRSLIMVTAKRSDGGVKYIMLYS